MQQCICTDSPIKAAFTRPRLQGLLQPHQVSNKSGVKADFKRSTHGTLSTPVRTDLAVAAACNTSSVDSHLCHLVCHGGGGWSCAWRRITYHSCNPKLQRDERLVFQFQTCSQTATRRPQTGNVGRTGLPEGQGETNMPLCRRT